MSLVDLTIDLAGNKATGVHKGVILDGEYREDISIYTLEKRGGRLSNAARVFTTRSRPMFTTRCRPMFTTCSRQMFTTDVRPVFTTDSRVVFTTGRSRREMSGRRWRISFRSLIES